MSETVTVTHLIAGTVAEKTYTGERITFHALPGGGALLTAYRGCRAVKYAWFAHPEIIERDIEEDA